MKLKPFLLLAISLLSWMANPLCAEAQPQSDGYVHDVIQLEEIHIDSYDPKGTTNVSGQTNLTVSSLSYAIAIRGSIDQNTWTNDYISLDKRLSHGFITTSSHGLAKKITLSWKNKFGSKAGITIYGRNSAYSSIAEAYDENSRGEEIASVDTNTEEYGATVELSPDYKYIAIIPNKTYYAAPAITSLDIAWQQTEYERDVTVGSLNTLCLPYDATVPSGMEVFEVLGKTMNGATPEGIDFAPVNEIVAGMPYVFITDNNLLHLDLTGETAVGTASNHNGLYGTFVDYPFASDPNYSDQYYIINGKNEIQAASIQSGVRANRAFVKMNEVPDISHPQALPSRRLVVTGHGFSIIDETNSMDHVATANISGRRGAVDLAGRSWTSSSSLQQGLYLLDGKKFIK